MLKIANLPTPQETEEHQRQVIGYCGVILKRWVQNYIFYFAKSEFLVVNQNNVNNPLVKTRILYTVPTMNLNKMSSCHVVSKGKYIIKNVRMEKGALLIC